MEQKIDVVVESTDSNFRVARKIYFSPGDVITIRLRSESFGKVSIFEEKHVMSVDDSDLPF